MEPYAQGATPMQKNINVLEVSTSLMGTALQRVKNWAEENPCGVLLLKGCMLWGTFAITMFVVY